MLHIVTSTTHKTLRGPRGGIILIGKSPLILGAKRRQPKGEIEIMCRFDQLQKFPGLFGRNCGTRHCIKKLLHSVKSWDPRNSRIVLPSEGKMRPYWRGFNTTSRVACDQTPGGPTDNWLCLVACVANILILTGKVAEKGIWYLPNLAAATRIWFVR